MNEEHSVKKTDLEQLRGILEQFDRDVILEAVSELSLGLELPLLSPGLNLQASVLPMLSQDRHWRELSRCFCGGRVEITYRYTQDGANIKINKIQIEFFKWSACPTDCVDDFIRGDRGIGRLRFKCPTDECVLTDENIGRWTIDDSNGTAKCGIHFWWKRDDGSYVGADHEYIKGPLSRGQRIPPPTRITAECDLSEADIDFIEILVCAGSGGCGVMSALPVKFVYKDGKVTDTGRGEGGPEEDLGGGNKQKKISYEVNCQTSKQEHPCARAEGRRCKPRR